MTGARLPHSATRAKQCQFFARNSFPLFAMQIDSLLSKAVVMERLGVGEKTLRRLIREGRLAVVKFGKTSPLKFRQLDVARFLEASTVSGPSLR